MKTLVVDLDGTITVDSNLEYSEKVPNKLVVAKLREYKEKGYQIIINTARNMNSFEGDISKINKETLPVALSWLNRHEVPFDGIVVGKPWCGFEGFYIDDRAIRPSEFVSLSQEDIDDLLLTEQKLLRSHEC
jgi:capsule biosynthesis phosphatase